MTVGSINALTGIEQAVRGAAQATGVDFNFLMRTAKRESGFDAGAKAVSSSAAGLFQFIEQTWLATVKRHGAAHGYARYADLITEGADGRFRVQGEEAKKVVMDLRYDPHCAAIMAGELASDHAAYLRGRTGREPTGGELYAAHFLGPQGSAKLIEAAQPDALRHRRLPVSRRGPSSNHGVFYRDGRALSVSEVYADLGRTGGTSAAAMEADPGEGAFTQYAGAGRAERVREQAMLMQFILSAPDDTGASSSPVNAMMTAEMLSAFAKAKGTGQ